MGRRSGTSEGNEKMHTEVRLENLKGKCGRRDRWWEDSIQLVAVNSRLSTWHSFLSVSAIGTTLVPDDRRSFFVTLLMRFVSQVPLSGTLLSVCSS